ncbi:MAG: O-antigen ligase family protein [Nitrospirae bacterium]|nr:O-antigen ligase family protein [Nitrospirota bacterium]MCL5976704.1 O-antigen ligase family protein [Nitrospirota bacterium]
MFIISKMSFAKIAIPLILISITVMFTHGVFSPLGDLGISKNTKLLQNSLSGISEKLQLSEIIFLIIFICALIRFIIEKRRIYWSPFIKPMIVYLSIVAFSITISVSPRNSLIEFIGLLYLVVFFLLWINIVDTKELLNYAVRWWIIVSVAVSIIGLSGVILAYGFGINNIFVKYFGKHPYVEDIYRVCSTFFQNEKFFSSYLLISIALTLSLALHEKNRSKRIFLLGIVLLFSINVFFTYSRSIVGILLAAYMVIFGSRVVSEQSKKRFVKVSKRLGAAFIIAVWVLVLFFSYVQLIDMSSNTMALFDLPENMKEPFYYRPDIGIKQTEITLHYNYTYYLLLKQYALKMLAERPLMGVGGGAFIEQMKNYSRDGKAPRDYLLFDPHSTFFGALAEIGIIGFIALMYLWFSIMVPLKNRLKSSVMQPDFHLILAFYAATVGFFVQGSDIDIMNFRFLWLLFGFGAIALRFNERIGEYNDSRE